MRRRRKPRVSLGRRAVPAPSRRSRRSHAPRDQPARVGDAGCRSPGAPRPARAVTAAGHGWGRPHDQGGHGHLRVHRARLVDRHPQHLGSDDPGLAADGRCLHHRHLGSLLRTGAAPRWLALTGTVLSFALIVGPFFSRWIGLLFPLWILALSLDIMITSRHEDAGA